MEFKETTKLLPCEVCKVIFKARIYKHGYTDKICSTVCNLTRRIGLIQDTYCLACGDIIPSTYKSQERKYCNRDCYHNKNNPALIARIKAENKQMIQDIENLLENTEKS